MLSLSLPPLASPEIKWLETQSSAWPTVNTCRGLHSVQFIIRLISLLAYSPRLVYFPRAWIVLPLIHGDSCCLSFQDDSQDHPVVGKMHRPESLGVLKCRFAYRNRELLSLPHPTRVHCKERCCWDSDSLFSSIKTVFYFHGIYLQVFVDFLGESPLSCWTSHNLSGNSKWGWPAEPRVPCPDLRNLHGGGEHPAAGTDAGIEHRLQPPGLRTLCYYLRVLPRRTEKSNLAFSPAAVTRRPSLPFPFLTQFHSSVHFLPHFSLPLFPEPLCVTL